MNNLRGQTGIIGMIVGILVVMIITFVLIPPIASGIVNAKAGGVALGNEAFAPIESLSTVFVVLTAMVGISVLVALFGGYGVADSDETGEVAIRPVVKHNALSGFSLTGVTPMYK